MPFSGLASASEFSLTFCLDPDSSNFSSIDLSIETSLLSNMPYSSLLFSFLLVLEGMDKGVLIFPMLFCVKEFNDCNSDKSSLFFRFVSWSGKTSWTSIKMMTKFKWCCKNSNLQEISFQEISKFERYFVPGFLIASSKDDQYQ